MDVSSTGADVARAAQEATQLFGGGCIVAFPLHYSIDAFPQAPGVLTLTQGALHHSIDPGWLCCSTKFVMI